jgi:hypothetical protein
MSVNILAKLVGGPIRLPGTALAKWRSGEDGQESKTPDDVSSDSNESEANESEASSSGDEDSDSGDSEASGDSGDSDDDSEEESGKSGSDSGDDSGDDSDDGSESGSGGSGDSDDDSEDESGGASGSDTEESDGDSDGDSEGDSSGGEDSDGGEGDAPGEGEDVGGEGEPSEKGSEPNSGQEAALQDEHSPDAGGRGADDDGMEDFAKKLLEAWANDEESGLMTSNEALEAANEGEGEGEDDLQAGEFPWSPASTDNDTVKFARSSEESKALAQKARKKVRPEVAALRARLRNKFLQARTPKTSHGVRRGQGLSERRLVNSMVELRSGRRPTRPDWRKEIRQECSLSAAVIIDQSGSMCAQLVRCAMQGAIAIAESLDSLGSPCLVAGPRNGGYGYNYQSSGERTYIYEGGEYKQIHHRESNVHIDIFKDWSEGMSTALPRFGSFLSCGSTPLSDGIQFALQELNTRTETHRVVFVITDGCPDASAVVKHQIRVAADAGVTIIGLGIGSGASYVQGMFPTHVYSYSVEGVAKKILDVLEGIMFPKRVRKIETGAKIA